VVRHRILAGTFLAAALVAVPGGRSLEAAGANAGLLVQAETVTGSWEMEIDVPGNPMPLRGNFTQKDKVFTGKVASALGENDVTGTIDGAAFKLSFVASGGVTISLTGTLKGDTLAGKATMTGQDEEMDWTGKRAK
jgi:hypothetical protein